MGLLSQDLCSEGPNRNRQLKLSGAQGGPHNPNPDWTQPSAKGRAARISPEGKYPPSFQEPVAALLCKQPLLNSGTGQATASVPALLVHCIQNASSAAMCRGFQEVHLISQNKERLG